MGFIKDTLQARQTLTSKINKTPRWLKKPFTQLKIKN